MATAQKAGAAVAQRDEDSPELTGVSIEGGEQLTVAAPFAVVSAAVREGWANGGEVELPLPGGIERLPARRILAVRELTRPTWRPRTAGQASAAGSAEGKQASAHDATTGTERKLALVAPPEPATKDTTGTADQNAAIQVGRSGAEPTQAPRDAGLRPAVDARPRSASNELFCPVCSDVVLTVDGVCPWCETPLGQRPRSVARGGTPKPRKGRPRGHTQPRSHKRTSLAGLKPAPPPDPIALLQDDAPQPAGITDRKRGMTEPFVREAMQVYLETHLSVLDAARVLFERYPGRWSKPESMRCGLVYCFDKRGVLVEGDRRSIRHRPALLARERELIEAYLRTPDPGYAYRGPIPPEVVWEAAWRYYIDGYGFLRITRLLKARWPWLTRSQDKSFCSKLHYVFRVNGWPTRPQREATAAANYRHGMSIHRDKAVYNRHRKREQTGGVRPHCDETSKITGKPCGNFAMHGQTKCWAHSERTSQAREAALSSGRRAVQRELVDSAPFVTWLRARVTAYGSQKATAPIVGLSESILGRILKTGGTSTPGKVTRRLIERSLAAALNNDPDLVVPRFKDLYDTTPQADAQLPAPIPRPGVAASERLAA